MTLHTDAARVLTAWRPPEPAQAALRERYLKHLRTHPDAMRRSCTPGHLTASALVVDPTRSRVLLTLHAKLDMWLQTGGHCESDDTTLAGAALREAHEESGIDGLRLLPEPARLDRHTVPCFGPSHPPTSHLDVQYVALAPPGARARISAESADLRWFGYAALPPRTDDSVRRLVGAAQRLVG